MKSAFLLCRAARITLLALLAATACGQRDVSGPLPVSNLTIWQLPSQSTGQMMSYVIESDSGRLVVIDGGYPQDADYLSTFLNGRPVDAWFITHPHTDHVYALTELLSRPGPHTWIKQIYWADVGHAWAQAAEPAQVYSYENFLQAVQKSGVPLRSLSKGERVRAGGREWKVLSAYNPELPGYNNSTLVLKIEDPQSVLFLGDSKPENSDKLLAENPGALRARVVQMAHHGNTGPRRAFYEAIQPEIALWPTVDWLWRNDSGQGTNSGPWTTIETREVMRAIGVKINLAQADGLQGLRLFSDGTFQILKP